MTEEQLIYTPGRMIGPPQLVRLSHQRAKVAHLLCEGLSNCEIGARLDISEDTVKTHVKDILQVLKSGTRTQAVARLYRKEVVVLVKNLESGRRFKRMVVEDEDDPL